MGIFGNRRRSAEPETFSVRVILYDGETGLHLNGRVWCDGESPRDAFAINSIEFGGFVHAGFNVNVEVAGYKNGWVPVIHPISQTLHVRMTKLPIILPAYEKPKGIVRANGFSFKDDNGDFLSLGATFFAAGWLFHNDKDKLIKNLEKLAGHFTHIRVLMEVGGSSWSDRQMNPMNIDWGALVELVALYGMRTQLSIFGDTHFSDTSAKRTAVIERVKNLCNEYPHLIHYVEITNEGNVPDIQEAIEHANYLKANIPQLVALTSDNLQWNGQQIYTYHPERDELATPWRWIRQHWDPSLGIEIIRDANEPKGPGSSLSSEDDTLRNIMGAACYQMTGGFVFHARPLVRSGGWGDLQFGYPTDINDLANIDTILKGFDYIRKILPKDLPNWLKLNGHWPGHPLPADHIWSDGFDHGVHRTYAAIRDGKFFTFPINIKQFVNLTALDKCEIKIHDVVRCEVVRTLSLEANETFRLDGRDDGNAAFIIEGVKQ